MGNAIELIRKAKIGSLVAVQEEVEYKDSGLDYFAKLADYGRRKNCILFESAELLPKYGEKTIGIFDPCLKIEGRQEHFEIMALNNLGEKLIKFLHGDFDFCDKVNYKGSFIKGRLSHVRKAVDEDERLKLKSHMDIIRTLAFKFKPVNDTAAPSCGLFGYISYDFVDQFEDLPKKQQDVLNEPDYELFFADSMFMMDHKAKKLILTANALVMKNKNRKGLYAECKDKIEFYKKTLSKKIPKKRKFKDEKQKIKTDCSKKNFIKIAAGLKKHILNGDAYQIVPSRTIITNYNAEPFDIYRQLRFLNPSPYMFYINSGNGILLGASPEMSLRVHGAEEKIVEIRPIAGTKPRGFINGRIDTDLDSRYETELKMDAKEIAEHIMLVDLARNDIARISKPGTRHVSESMVVEKYSHVQHLVSNVKGILKPEFDALHAYSASMNMGTLTGAPKVEAMKLIRQVEKTKRGSYGGCVCYLTPNGNFDSAIIIRSMRIKGKNAYIRAGAGIVYDSIPENEFYESERKAQACLEAVKNAGGLK